MKPEGPLNFTSLWINPSLRFIHESFIFWFTFKQEILYLTRDLQGIG